MSISHEESGLLDSLPTLAGLQESDQGEAVHAAKPVMFAEGAEVVRQGDIADAFFVVLQGQIEITTCLDQGRGIVLAQLGPGGKGLDQAGCQAWASSRTLSSSRSS